MTKSSAAMRLRAHVVSLVAVFLVGMLAAPGQNTPDPWLISSDNASPIGKHTTLDDLVRKYGAKNVVERDVDVGEGETEPGVVLFPGDPARSLEIIWRDEKKKDGPKSVILHGKASRWKAVHGISLGTTLKELEALNRRPFSLYGFGWDYSGAINSWEGGLLEKQAPPLVLRLSPPGGTLTPEKLAGDSLFSSDDELMQRLNPRVYFLMWQFSR
jgi:hypothetical protein